MEVSEIKAMFLVNLSPDEQVIEGYRNLALMINNSLPDGRLKSIALTKLQESFLFATS